MAGAFSYFLFFASVGIYIPYWTLYLWHRNLTSVQVATIAAIPAVARVFFPILYGYLADRWHARKSFLTYCSFAQILPLTLLLYLESYAWLLIAVSLFSIFNVAILPFIEATAQEEHVRGRLDYGKTRLWGTLSFVLLALGFGKFLDYAGYDWILYGLLIFLTLLAFSSLLLPAGSVKIRLEHRQIKTILLRPRVWCFFACIFLMQVSHSTFYGFYSIYLSERGYADSSIGVQWAVAAGSELIIFFFATRILQAFSHYFLFSLCLVLAAIRWTLMYSTESFVALTMTQCLHAFTFGVFHITSLQLILRFFAEGYRSLGQTMYSASSGGFGAVIGLMLNGYLWDRYREKSFLISGVIALLAFGLSLILVRSSKEQDHSADKVWID